MNYRCAAHGRLWYERARGMFPHARNHRSRVISERSAILAQKLAPRVRRVVPDCEIKSYNLLILGFLMAVRWLAESVGGFPTCLRRYPAATVKNGSP